MIRRTNDELHFAVDEWHYNNNLQTTQSDDRRLQLRIVEKIIW